MTQILYSAIGTLIVILAHDLVIISSRLIIRRRNERQKNELLEKMKMYRQKFDEWMEQYTPGEYGDEKEFTLKLCSKCEKLKKSIIEQEDGDICLDCRVAE